MSVQTVSPAPTDVIIGDYATRQWANIKGQLCAGLFRIMKAGPRKGELVPVRGSQFYFKTEERRQEWLTSQKNDMERWLRDQQDRDKKKKEDREKPHDFQVGDILYSSWGYEQTNVDFYQVIDRTDRSVIFRPIGGEMVPGSEGMMCGQIRPVKDKFIGEPMRRTVNNGYVSLGRYSLSRYTDGDKGTYCSWYA